MTSGQLVFTSLFAIQFCLAHGGNWAYAGDPPEPAYFVAQPPLDMDIQAADAYTQLYQARNEALLAKATQAYKTRLEALKQAVRKAKKEKTKQARREVKKKFANLAKAYYQRIIYKIARARAPEHPKLQKLQKSAKQFSNQAQKFFEKPSRSNLELLKESHLRLSRHLKISNQLLRTRKPPEELQKGLGQTRSEEKAVGVVPSKAKLPPQKQVIIPTQQQTAIQVDAKVPQQKETQIKEEKARTALQAQFQEERRQIAVKAQLHADAIERKQEEEKRKEALSLQEQAQKAELEKQRHTDEDEAQKRKEEEKLLVEEKRRTEARQLQEALLNEQKFHADTEAHQRKGTQIEEEKARTALMAQINAQLAEDKQKAEAELEKQRQAATAVDRKRQKEEKLRLEAEALRLQKAQKAATPQDYCFIVSGLTKDHNSAFAGYKTATTAIGPPYGSRRCQIVSSWEELAQAHTHLKVNAHDKVFVVQTAHGSKGGSCSLDSGRANPDQILTTLTDLAIHSHLGVVLESCFSGDLVPKLMEKISQTSPDRAKTIASHLCLHTSIAEHVGRSIADKTVFDQIQAGQNMEDLYRANPFDGIISSALLHQQPEGQWMIAPTGTTQDLCPLDLPSTTDLCTESSCHCQRETLAQPLGQAGHALVGDLHAILDHRRTKWACTSTKQAIIQSFQHSPSDPDSFHNITERRKACQDFTFPAAESSLLADFPNARSFDYALRIVHPEQLEDLLTRHPVPKGSEFDQSLCKHQTKIFLGFPALLTQSRSDDLIGRLSRCTSPPIEINLQYIIQTLIAELNKTPPPSTLDRIQLLRALGTLDTSIPDNHPQMGINELHKITSAQDSIPAIRLAAYRAIHRLRPHEGYRIVNGLIHEEKGVHLEGILGSGPPINDEQTQLALVKLLETPGLSTHQTESIAKILAKMTILPTVQLHLIQALQLPLTGFTLGKLSEIIKKFALSLDLASKQDLFKTVLQIQDEFGAQELMKIFQPSDFQNPALRNDCLETLSGAPTRQARHAALNAIKHFPEDPTLEIQLQTALLANLTHSDQTLQINATYALAQRKTKLTESTKETLRSILTTPSLPPKMIGNIQAALSQ